MISRLKPKGKRQLLAEYIEIQVEIGCDISELVGRELSYYDWEDIQRTVDKLRYAEEEE